MAEILPILPGGKLGALDLIAAQVAATTPSVFANDGQSLLIVTVGATLTNLTVTGASCSHGRPLSNVIPLAANKTYILGPFPQNEFNDANGKVNLSFSSVATITVAVLKHI